MSTPILLGSEKAPGFVTELINFQIEISRKLLNTSLLFQDIQPALLELKSKYDEDGSSASIVYRVPHVKKRAFALIRNEQRREYIQDFIERGFFEATLIACIAFYEGWVEEYLRRIYSLFPTKIGDFASTSIEKVFTKGAQSSLPFEKQLDALLARFSHANASEQAKILESLKLARNKDGIFDEYVEINQTRNLLVHKNGIVDQKYVYMSGKFARGNVGEKIPMNIGYYMRAIAVIKEFTEIIRFCSIDYLSHKGAEPYVLDDPPYQFVKDYQIRS